MGLRGGSLMDSGMRFGTFRGMSLITKRLAIHSDFHVENSGHGPRLRPSIAAADLLVVAGDISPPCHRLLKKGRHGALSWLRQATGFSGPVVFVMGNNDYNHYPYEEVIAALRQEALENDIHFLHNESAVVEGIEFLGTPLFTDFRLPGVDPNVMAMETDRKLASFNRKRLDTDYCICMSKPICARPHWEETDNPQGVRLSDGSAGRKEWLLKEHQKSVDFLTQATSCRIERPRLVVSHWAPSLQSIAHDEWPLGAKHGYWASNQEHLVVKSNAWIHGHVHAAPHYRVGNDPHFGLVLSNCLGTPEALFANGRYRPHGELVIQWNQDTPDRPDISWA